MGSVCSGDGTQSTPRRYFLRIPRYFGLAVERPTLYAKVSGSSLACEVFGGLGFGMTFFLSFGRSLQLRTSRSVRGSRSSSLRFLALLFFGTLSSVPGEFFFVSPFCHFLHKAAGKSPVFLLTYFYRCRTAVRFILVYTGPPGDLLFIRWCCSVPLVRSNAIKRFLLMLSC